MIFSLSALPVYLKPVGFLHISFYQFYKSPLCPIYSIRSCFFPILDKLRLSFNVQQIKPAHTHPGLQTKDTLAPSWRFSGNSTRPLGRCSRKAPQDFTGEKEPNRNNSSVWRKKNTSHICQARWQPRDLHMQEPQDSEVQRNSSMESVAWLTAVKQFLLGREKNHICLGVYS